MSLSTLALFLTRQSMTGGGQRTLYTVGKEVTTADMVTEVTEVTGGHEVGTADGRMMCNSHCRCISSIIYLKTNQPLHY